VKAHQITVNRYVICCIAAASLQIGASISSAQAAITDLPLEGPSGPAAGGGGGSAGQSGGGPRQNFSAQPGPSGPSMENRGPTGNVYNRANTENGGGNRSRFTERNRGNRFRTR
jgi:hypothetical protein